MVCVWLLLGAIINPNNFLVYSTAALTFLTFLSSKYQAFQKISEDGFKMIKDQVFNIIQGQIKSIIGFMIEEVKELSVIGKDLMNSDAAKFAFEKADALGLGDEVAAIKNLTEKTLDNPDKLVNSALSAANSFLSDPNAMIEKLKKAEDQLKEKAITVFKTKCTAHNIPEDLIDIFLSLNFKDEEKLKQCIAQLVENKSEVVLGQKINKQLIKSILDLIIHPKNVKDPTELSKIVTQELVANVIELFFVRTFNADKTLGDAERKNVLCIDVKNYREVILRTFSLISSLKDKNTKVCIQEMRKLMKLLSGNASESKAMNQTLELLDIVMTIKNEAQYKQRVLKFLYDNISDSDLYEFLSIAIFSAPDEQIQDIGKKKYTKSENISGVVESILDKKYSVKLPYPKLLGTLVSFGVKSLKNQLESSDIDDAVDILYKFLEDILKKDDIIKKEDLLKKEETVKKEFLKPPFKKDLSKVLQIGPLFTYFGKNNDCYWKEIAKKYDIEITSIKEIILLMTENYWQNFFNKKIECLSESQIMPIISTKLKMSNEELLGFISMFNGELNHRYVEDFLNSLIDYEKTPFPTKFQTFIKQFVKILFCDYNGFIIATQLNELGVKTKLRNDFLKDNGLLDQQTATLLQIPNEVSPLLLIKRIKDKDKEKDVKAIEDDFLNKLLDVVGIKEKIPELKDFLNRIKNLFALRKIPKNYLRKNIEIKTNVSSFAEKYKYDNDGLELLLFILMGDYNQSLRGFAYFLEGQTQFPYKANSYKQIVRTILNEDKMMKGSTFMKCIDKWLPEGEGKDKQFLNDDERDFLTKSFQHVTWFGYDATSFAQRLSTIGLDKDLSEAEKEQQTQVIIEKSNKLSLITFKLFHVSELMSIGLQPLNLFPIYKDQQDDGQTNLKIDDYFEAEEEVFKEKDVSNIRGYPILKEKMLKADKINFNTTLEKFSLLIFGDNDRIEKMITILFDHFFHLYDKNLQKSNINWADRKNIEKYVVLFCFLNNKFQLEVGEEKPLNYVMDYTEEASTDKLRMKRQKFQFLWEYCRKNFSMNSNELFDFNEFNRILKFFFTTDPEVFAKGLIQNFNEFHGKLNDLIDIFSICSLKPSIESLSVILSLPSTEIESVFNICRFYYAKNNQEQTDILQANERWFKKLGIDFNELLLLLKFLRNDLDPYVFPKFVSAFSLNKHVNNKVLQSIFALFAKTENFDDDFENFLKLSHDRKTIFDAIGINSSLGDLFCDIIEGNFWNLKNIIQCNIMLSQIKIFPENGKNVIETISCFIGGISNNIKINTKLEDLFSKFISGNIKKGNNHETIAYLMFSNFKLSPLMSLLLLDEKTAYAAFAKYDKIISLKIKQIIKVFDKLSLPQKNRIAELDFGFLVSCEVSAKNTQNKVGGIDNKKVSGPTHFYNNLFKKMRSSSKTNSKVGSKEDVLLKGESKEEEKKEIIGYNSDSESEYEIPKNIAYFDLYHNFCEIGKIINSKLEEAWKDMKDDDKKLKDDVDHFKAVDDNPEEINDRYEHFMITIAVMEFLDEANCAGVSTNLKDDFNNMGSCFSKLVMLSLLRSLRGLFAKKTEEKTPAKDQIVKDQANKEIKEENKENIAKNRKNEKEDEKKRLALEKEEQYKDMIKFGLNLDLLFTTMEKLKFLNEEFETFHDFDKNALLKFLIPIFCSESIEEKDDFILEFFFRNSIFENDVMGKILEEMDNILGRKSSKIAKLAGILYDSDIPPLYFSNSTDKNIENYLSKGVENFRTYEDLDKAIQKAPEVLPVEEVFPITQEEGKPQKGRKDINKNKKNEKIIIKLDLEFHEAKRKFLKELIEMKNKEKNYKEFKFFSYEALEDYYPESKAAQHANKQCVMEEMKKLQNEGITFFSQENFNKIKKIPLFEKNLDFFKSCKLTEQLNGLFRKFQMLKGDYGKEIFANLLTLFKEKSKLSKNGSKALESILAKISFSLKSNYNNLKMMLDFLLKKNIDANEFEACLAKMDIKPWTFYGLALPHLKMSAVLNNSHSSSFLKNVPEFLFKMLKFPSELIDEKSMNEIIPEKKNWLHFVRFFNIF